MTLLRLRHRLALLIMRVSIRIARFIHGPLNPEELYVKQPLMEYPIHRLPRVKRDARPRVSSIRELSDEGKLREVSELEFAQGVMED